MADNYSWQYIADTHSDSVRIEILMGIPPASEFRIHNTYFKPGAGAWPHSHEWEHAMYITGGTGRITVGDKVIEVKKGSMVLVPIGVTHSVLNTNNNEELVVFGVSGPPKTEAGWAQLKKI